MRNVVIPAIVLGVIGLVVGYFLFARYGNGYIPLARLFGAPHGLVGHLENAITNVFVNLAVVRRNILVSGLVGLVVGLVAGLSVLRRR